MNKIKILFIMILRFLKSVVIIKISCPRSLEQRNSSSFNVAVGAGRNIQNDIAVGGLFKTGIITAKINGIPYYKFLLR